MTDITGWIALKPNAPLSTATAVAAVFLAPVLLLYVDEPLLVQALDGATLILLAAAIGFPILTLSAFVFLVILQGLAEWDQPTEGPLRQSILRLASNEPPLEWASVWGGASLANVILYGLAARAVFYPLDLKSSVLLIGLILAAVGLIAMLVVIFAVAYKRHKIEQTRAVTVRGEAAPVPTDNPESAPWLTGFISGQSVEHETYGKGKITGLSHLKDQDYRMTVRFESGHKAMFQAPYKGIRKT